MEIKQYQIVLVNLDPTIGSEMKKTRPCVVISPDEMNKYLRAIVVAPMTSSSKSYPTRVIRTIDRKRIVKLFNSLTDKEISKVKTIIQETYVD
jgi:mRNA interferase MazF